MLDGGFHHQVINATRIHRVIRSINVVVLALLKEQRQHQRIPKIPLTGLVVPNAQGIDDVLARKVVLVRKTSVVQAVHKGGAAGKMTHHHPNDATRTTNRLVNGLLPIRPMSGNHVVGTTLIGLVTQRVYRVVTHRNIVTTKQVSTGELLFFRLVRQRKRRAQFHFLNTRGKCLLNFLGILGDFFGGFFYARSRNPVPLGIRPLVIARRGSVRVDRHPLISIPQ